MDYGSLFMADALACSISLGAEIGCMGNSHAAKPGWLDRYAPNAPLKLDCIAFLSPIFSANVFNPEEEISVGRKARTTLSVTEGEGRGESGKNLG
jgi:hypothetical protein